MWCIKPLVAFFLCIFSVIPVSGAPPAHVPSQQPSLGVIEPRDLVIARSFRGRPLPRTLTIYTLYSAELDLYRNTVFHYGDAEVPSIIIGVGRELQLEIIPIARDYPTLGSSFYGVCYILQIMLHPDYPGEDFFESKWRVSNRVLVPGREVPMIYLNLLLHGDGSLR